MFRLKFILLLPLLFLVGCTTVIEMVANTFPTYDETVKAWPALTENQGRIVIFSPKSIVELPTFSRCRSAPTIDGIPYEGIMNGTFIFVDVKKGAHVFSCSKTGTPNFELDIRGGEIVHVEMGKAENKESPLLLVEKQAAYDKLKDLNHAFDDAIPYDKQPLTIKRRKN
jgi:hypothetical protein